MQKIQNRMRAAQQPTDMTLQAQLGHHIRENASLHSQVIALTRKQAQYELEIQRVQKLVLELNSAKIWQPEPDSVLRIEVKDLHEYIREFADEYASDNRAAVGEGWLDVPSCLKSAVRTGEKGGPVVMKGAKAGGGECAVLLASLLTREVYGSMFENAFFLEDEKNAIRTRYKERRKSKNSSASGADMITRSTILTDTYRDLCKYSVTEAEAWRSQYFRVLLQELRNTDPSRRYQGDCNQKINSFAEVFVECFEAGELAPFLRKIPNRESMARVAMLQDIVCKAARLFIRLRAQRYVLQLANEEDLLRKRFQVCHPLMEADRLLSLHYDDRRLDGARVDVLVSPAIYLEDGNGGAKTTRVLSKAIVWVRDDS